MLTVVSPAFGDEVLNIGFKVTGTATGVREFLPIEGLAPRQRPPAPPDVYFTIWNETFKGTFHSKKTVDGEIFGTFSVDASSRYLGTTYAVVWSAIPGTDPPQRIDSQSITLNVVQLKIGPAKVWPH